MSNMKIGPSVVSKVYRPPERTEVAPVANRAPGASRSTPRTPSDRYDRTSGAAAGLGSKSVKDSAFTTSSATSPEQVKLSPALEPYRQKLLDIAKKLAPDPKIDSFDKARNAVRKELKQTEDFPKDLLDEGSKAGAEMTMLFKGSSTGEEKGSQYKYLTSFKGKDLKNEIGKLLDQRGIFDPAARRAEEKNIRAEVRRLKKEERAGKAEDVGPGEEVSPEKRLENLARNLERLPRKLEEHRGELEEITQRLARDPSLNTDAKLRKALWSELKQVPLADNLKQGARQFLFDALTRQMDRFTTQPVREG
jgi:hypothetical protein